MKIIPDFELFNVKFCEGKKNEAEKVTKKKECLGGGGRTGRDETVNEVGERDGWRNVDKDVDEGCKE